jgi:hypothetical protein
MRCPNLAPLLAALAALLSTAGCGRHEPSVAVPTASELEADPILLSRVLARCNAEPSAATTAECSNARAAVDRQSVSEDARRAKKAETGFEMARDARRRAEEAARQSKEALEKRMSPYELPVEGEGAKPPPSEP